MKVAMDEIVTSTKILNVDDNSSDKVDSSSDERDEEFINTGLHRWESIRSAWLASCTKPSTPRHAKNIDVDEVIDLIVSNRWRQTLPPSSSKGESGTAYSSASSLDTAKSATRRRDEACFERPVGLPQMIDVLVDLWEAEGLDT